MNFKESQMPAVDGVEAEKRRKAYEAEAAALSKSIETIEPRLNKMITLLKRVREEIQDGISDKRPRVRPCKCGRQWTRFEFCVICLSEKL